MNKETDKVLFEFPVLWNEWDPEGWIMERLDGTRYLKMTHYGAEYEAETEELHGLICQYETVLKQTQTALSMLTPRVSGTGKKLILTIGLPRSGKSTWARQQGHPIVNRDAIRLALHGQPYIQEREGEVTAIENLMVKALFLAGHETVIVDACHMTRKRRERWLRPIDSGEWEVEYEFFPVGPDECKRRARATGRTDLIPVIERMSKETDVEAIREADGLVRLHKR